ncbi:hypothetical protein [Crocinitomix algicola]|uniref:hypothetical protein n=1 Tax=Crocinitomix algicola TaxID=1740263 RepID=UPI001112DEF5|nr:hypothetical protein [Crocinitomix algicola]
MKNLFLFLILTTFAFNANTQPPYYDDLLIYYADGNYEKLISKAEKYMGNDDTKNDPWPYLYSSKANFEMSKDQQYEEDFPKAFNDAIGDAGKAIKKDKTGEVYDREKAYFTELKEYIVEEIKNMVDIEDYSRLRGKVMKLQRMDPTDIGSYYLLAACQYQIKDKGGAKISFNKGQEKLDLVESVEDWRDIDFEMMRLGVIEYCNYMVQNRLCDNAKKLLNQVKQWYEDDEIFMNYYDDVVNGGC